MNVEKPLNPKIRPTYRKAVPGDAAAILKVFAEVAPAVPTVVNSETEAVIQGLVADDQSWVAVDAAGNIIGYALASPYDRTTLKLNYLGVAEADQHQGISSSLVSKLQEVGLPIITDVRHNNTSSMVKIFEHLGFVKCAPDPFSDQRTKLRWEQSAAAKESLVT